MGLTTEDLLALAEKENGDLRAKVAELTQVLNSEAGISRAALDMMKDRCGHFEEQLAASQAREQQRAEALELLWASEGQPDVGDLVTIEAARNIPSDTTALTRANKMYAAEVLDELAALFEAYDSDDAYVDAQISTAVTTDKAEQLRKEAGGA